MPAEVAVTFTSPQPGRGSTSAHRVLAACCVQWRHAIAQHRAASRHPPGRWPEPRDAVLALETEVLPGCRRLVEAFDGLRIAAGETMQATLTLRLALIGAMLDLWLDLADRIAARRFEGVSDPLQGRRLLCTVLDAVTDAMDTLCRQIEAAQADDGPAPGAEPFTIPMILHLDPLIEGFVAWAVAAQVDVECRRVAADATLGDTRSPAPVRRSGTPLTDWLCAIAFVWWLGS